MLMVEETAGELEGDAPEAEPKGTDSFECAAASGVSDRRYRTGTGNGHRIGG